MFCSRKDKETDQPCDTNLAAVGVAFVLPLVCIVLILFLAQGRVGEGLAALAVLLFLLLYFLVIRMLKIDFGKQATKRK
jgi:positive regulator of sigma E activity